MTSLSLLAGTTVKVMQFHIFVYYLYLIYKHLNYMTLNVAVLFDVAVLFSVSINPKYSFNISYQYVFSGCLQETSSCGISFMLLSHLSEYPCEYENLKFAA